MKLRSTKSYYNLPVAHMQWFDEGGTGPCSRWHGYDRSVHFEFSGEADEHGWIVGFGELRKIKDFLEYYFDHTALISADDPRMESALAAQEAGIVDLRVMPYGVSMEMSAIFIWEQVNPFIHAISDGRAYISRCECREHEKNSAFIEIPEHVARLQAERAEGYLVKEKYWDWVEPREILKYYKG